LKHEVDTSEEEFIFLTSFKSVSFIM